MPFSKHELRDRPPREPLTSLEACVRDWQWRFPRARRDTVLEFCREAPTLKDAIIRACDSRTPEGKCHNHQSRVPQAVREEFGNRLWWKRRGWLTAMDVVSAPHEMEPGMAGLRFDAMYDYVKHSDCIFPGIGPVTTYDILTRIGAHPTVNADPSSLYLHAGARAGWYALSGMPARWKGVERVTRPQMPVELRRLPADEIEDMVCAYRLIFQSPEFTDRGKWPR